MSIWNRDFVFLIRQFLWENKFTETMHRLEQESGYFFQFDYFEEKGMAGDWDEVEKYLSGFTKIDARARDYGSKFYNKMYYLIRRQKYLEALDRNDKDKASNVLRKDLRVFFDDGDEKYKELMTLLTLDDFRKSGKFSKYGDTINSVRERTIRKLKNLIETNNFSRDHAECLNESRLLTLINQSLNWQHQKCMNPKSNPVMENLVTNHACSSSNYTPNMKSSEIVVFATCYTITDRHDFTGKVVRLVYTNSGNGLLALDSTGTQKLWEWRSNDHLIFHMKEATADGVPHFWLRGKDVNNRNPQRAVVPCVAISNNASFVLSACGGKISWMGLDTLGKFPFQDLKATFMPPPPAATFLAFHPYNTDIIAIGMEDSSIHIYNLKMNMTLVELREGHQKHITGLSFSTTLNILVSSSADAQLCFWSIGEWELKKSLLIEMPEGKEPVGVTELQFHSDQVRLLVCHESHLATYDASKMEFIGQWVPPEALLSGSITSATYSCCSELIYASFTDGNVAVLDARNFSLRCRITSSAYLPRDSLSLFLRESSGKHVYPCVVAANPKEPNQLALGLSDGSVHVIEPLEYWRTWGSC